MSHFLSRLVERARGVAPHVEPIISPRFAPAPVSEINGTSEASPPRAAQEDLQSPAETKRLNPLLVRQNVEPSSEGKPELLVEVVRDTLLVPQEEVQKPTSKVVRQIRRAEEKSATANRGSLPAEIQQGSAPTRRMRAPASSLREHVADSPNEPSREPPIVRVTIGRIDVRAIAPPATSPRKKAPAPPSLTLDRYLTERKEGRR